jgi:hypothetical protein
MSTRNLPGGKGRPAREADNLTAICESIVLKMWEPRRLTTLWAFTACYMDSFTFFFLLVLKSAVFFLKVVLVHVCDDELTFQFEIHDGNRQ